MKNRTDAILNMRNELVRRREAIRRALAGDLGMLQELKDHASGDAADIAIGSCQDEISSQLVEVESRELGQIDKALERIEEGEYGSCEGCGNTIPIARLKALPYATLCVACQEETECIQRAESTQIDWSELVDPADSVLFSHSEPKAEVDMA